jgi:hypothetical protein
MSTKTPVEDTIIWRNVASKVSQVPAGYVYAMITFWVVVHNPLPLLKKWWDVCWEDVQHNINEIRKDVAHQRRTQGKISLIETNARILRACYDSFDRFVRDHYKPLNNGAHWVPSNHYLFDSSVQQNLQTLMLGIRCLRSHSTQTSNLLLPTIDPIIFDGFGGILQELIYDNTTEKCYSCKQFPHKCYCKTIEQEEEQQYAEEREDEDRLYSQPCKHGEYCCDFCDA